MRQMKYGILIFLAVLAIVSVASAALPFAPVNAKLVSTNAPVSYFNIDVTSGVTPELPVGMYAGWCTDFNHPVALTSYVFTAYSSLDTASFNPGMPSANWNKINYMLNNKNADWRITQAAMWHYDGLSAVPYPEHGIISGYSHSEYDAYIASVDANGANFVPSCGQLYAVILYKPGVQVVIVEMPTPECHDAPEFPTLALPVAMLIGVVGAVQFIRTRKE